MSKIESKLSKEESEKVDFFNAAEEQKKDIEFGSFYEAFKRFLDSERVRVVEEIQEEYGEDIYQKNKVLSEVNTYFYDQFSKLAEYTSLSSGKEINLEKEKNEWVE